MKKTTSTTDNESPKPQEEPVLLVLKLKQTNCSITSSPMTILVGCVF